MNESILQALMQLFALGAFRENNGALCIDRDVLYDYLERQFTSEMVNKYLQSFDQFILQFHPDTILENPENRKEQQKLNFKTAEEICAKLNLELRQEQKIIVLVYLLDFIYLTKDSSEYQLSFLENVTRGLNIPLDEYYDLRHFTFDEIEKIHARQNLLLIDSSKEAEEEDTKHLFIDKISGSIIVMQIPSTSTLVFRYHGDQVLLLNGHSVKHRRSYIWAQGSVIKNPKFGSIYYIWVAGQFIKASTQNQFVFTANDIEFSYGNSPNGIKRFSLNEESGRLIGIIGGSGSGKSTLLKVLAGIIKPHHGRIEINGHSIYHNEDDTDVENIVKKGLIGYVPQDDFLIKELTVWENLHYNARFSFSDCNNEEINNIVEKALLDFDLVEARDLRVGDALSTYLSGGQRKRLNIALELIREPAVLFVDEPTSGLSSSDSEKVMNLLKRQTIKGKLVFANIHQPSSDIFKLFDKLLVVDQGGRIVWYGNPIDALSYFKRMNNIVDAESSECLSCGNINPDQILRNIEARVVDVNGRLTRKRKTSPQKWYELYMERIDPIIQNIKRSHSGQLPPVHFKVPSRWEQIKLYFKRDLLAKLKNNQYLLITLFEAPVLALILAFYTRSSRDLGGNVMHYAFGQNNNIPAYLFMAIIVALFLGMVISAEEIFRDRKLLERERFLNLSRSSYLFSKVGIMFMISAIQMLLFTLIGNYILEIKGMTWRYFLILFTTAAWANLIGLNISSGFKSVVTIYILVPLILVPQLLFSGVVVDFYNLNKNIQSFKYVPLVGDAMTSRWSYEAIVISQYRDNEFQKHFFDIEFRMSDAMYTKAYLIPELTDRLEFINQNIDNRKNITQVQYDLALLSNELKKLCIKINTNYNSLIKDLNIRDYNPETYQKVLGFLINTRNQYHSIYLKALKDNDLMHSSLINEVGGIDNYNTFKNKYYNSQLVSIVRNEREMIQFFIYNDNIIKLKDPVYTLPVAFNGRSHFYAPMKRIGNFYIDTFWFNISMVWISTILWFIILYFDVLFQVLKYFENIRLRRFNQRITNILAKQYEKK